MVCPTLGLTMLMCSSDSFHLGESDDQHVLRVVALAAFFVSEVLVDWIKHMSICNYGGLSPHIYSEVCRQLSTVRILV